MGDLLILIGHFRGKCINCVELDYGTFPKLFRRFHDDYGSLSHLIRYCIVNGAPG